MGGRIEGWVELDLGKIFNQFECFQPNCKPHRRLGRIEFGLRFH